MAKSLRGLGGPAEPKAGIGSPGKRRFCALQTVGSVAGGNSSLGFAERAPTAIKTRFAGFVFGERSGRWNEPVVAKSG